MYMCIVPFAMDGFRRAVVVGDEDNDVVGDVGADNEDDGPRTQPICATLCISASTPDLLSF